MGDKLKTTAKQVEEPWDAAVRQPHLGQSGRQLKNKWIHQRDNWETRFPASQHRAGTLRM